MLKTTAIAIFATALFISQFAKADEAVWSAAGQEVLRLHGTTHYTARQRAEAMDQRVTEIFSNGDGTLNADEIVLNTTKESVCIVVDQKLLVTVASEDAKANHTTKVKLGKIWLWNLRKTLPLIAPRENKKGV